jgi:cytochrome b561
MAGAPYPYHAPLIRWVHWLMVLIMAVAAAGGVWTHYLPKDGALFGQVMLMHKSLGVVLCGLIIIRVLLRLVLGAPAYTPPLGWLNEKIAGLAHILMYAVMIAMPISGYVMTMASKHEFSMFGYWAVPNYIPADENLAKMAEGAHMYLAFALGGLVALHLLAALYHKMVGDKVYERMWPA